MPSKFAGPFLVTELEIPSRSQTIKIVFLVGVPGPRASYEPQYLLRFGFQHAYHFGGTGGATDFDSRFAWQSPSEARSLEIDPGPNVPLSLFRETAAKTVMINENFGTAAERQ